MLRGRPLTTAGAGNQLKRTLSFWEATASGVGIVIGAGIYVLVGSAAGEAGSALWLSFILAALLSSLTGLSYAELAGLLPTASAEYGFAKAAWGNFMAFMSGWMMIAANVIAAAAVSVGFGHYFSYFAGTDETIGAAGLLVVLLFLMFSGIQRLVWFSIVLLALEIGGLVLVILAGAPHIGDRSLLEGSSVSGVLGGAALVFFAFIGFDEIVSLSEETEGANKTTPRALLAALWISSLLYVLVAVAAVSVIDWRVLAEADAPLTLVIANDWGEQAADVVAFIALASTTNTALLILTAASREVFAVARDGRLPQALAKVSPRRRTPDLASIAVFGFALMLVLLGELRLLASVTDFAVYVIFLVVNTSLIALRFRLPRVVRPFRVPLSLGPVPVLPALGIISVCVMIVSLDPKAWLLGIAALLSGAILWFVFVPIWYRDSGARG